MIRGELYRGVWQDVGTRERLAELEAYLAHDETPTSLRTISSGAGGSRRRMGEGIAVVTTARSACAPRKQFPYRFDSHFYYLTGFGRARSGPRTDRGHSSLLFCREKARSARSGTGFVGPEAARERFGFDEAYPLAALVTG